MAFAWYTLIITPGYEQYVKKQLNEKKELKVSSIEISKSFVGYVFVKIDLKLENLSKFFEIEGTLNFLGKKCAVVNGKKVVVPEEISRRQITRIMNTAEKTEVIEEEKEECFRIGDCVCIKQGDFANIQGKIIELKKRTVRIRPDFFLNSKLIKVNIKDIESI